MEITKFCKRFMHLENAKLHFVDAHEGLSDCPDKRSLVRVCGVAADNVHARMGDPDKVSVEVTKSLDANLVALP